MTDIGPTIKGFVDSWKEKLFAGPVLVEEWYAEARQYLSKLREKTNASTDATSLRAATDAWTELSVLLKLLLQADQDVHFPGFIDEACTVWWDCVTERQIKLGCAVAEAYRAMAAYVVAQLAFRRRDRGAALRWASLGYLADKLGGSLPGGGNEVTLRFGLAVPTEVLQLLDKLASDGISKQGIEGLPEWLFAEALDDPNGLGLVAPSELYSHHASTPFVKAAAEHVLADRGTTAEKGERLERLAAFLASTVPGMRPQRRLVAAGSTAEYDVVATLFGETPYPLPARATEWLIECKNWKDPVSVGKVGHFLAKMQHAGAKFGIIIANKDVTGAEEHKHADRFRIEFSLREGLVCLVVGAADLWQLGDGGSFRGLIDKKYEEWRFGE